MSELKDSWKKTGKDTGNAFKSFGKAMAKTVKTAVRKADEALNKDEKANKDGVSEDATVVDVEDAK